MVAKFFGSLFGGGADPRSAAVPGEDALAGSEPEDELGATARSLEDLRRMVLSNGREFPPFVVSQVLQLADILRELIDYIADGSASTEQRVLLNAVITDYLPSPLQSYLKLADAARTDDSPNTATLSEQLGTLHSTVRNLDNQVRTGAITELAVHGQFLKDKFNIDGLHLEGQS